MNQPEIGMAHGGGGRAGSALIAEEILSRFGDGPLAGLPDAASLPGGLIFSTDSFVVTPRFFPGGNVGKIAVCGTVNDIAVSGGIPEFLSLAMILEEGFPREELRAILDAVQETAAACRVKIATGDTKVVPRGAADGIYLNTAGVGHADPRFRLSREAIRCGDAVIVSGAIGDHGMAVLAARHGIGGDGVASDCAPVLAQTAAAAEFGGAVRFMRDPTRGGVAAVTTEIIGGKPWSIELEEPAIPVTEAVRTLSGMLGVDPLFAACEGRVVAVVAEDAAEDLLRIWRGLPGGSMAARIGTVTEDAPGQVMVRGAFGGKRILLLPEGDPLPRIC
ncbi:MAG: hydrogenase expression/formation protein HypE [Lentisphaeria bacterium]|nr:hydrogenase expression/formation protein HypE [Lentisphaeria bacterium]